MPYLLSAQFFCNSNFCALSSQQGKLLFAESAKLDPVRLTGIDKRDREEQTHNTRRGPWRSAISIETAKKISINDDYDDAG